MTRSKDSFALMNFGTNSIANIIIEDAVLYVRRCFIHPAVLKAHEDGIQKHNAIYPVQKQQCSSYVVNSGVLSDSREIIVSSDRPKLIVVGMVSNKAFNGDFSLNPFNFQHFGLSSITLYKNGEPIPFPTQDMDYSKGLYMKPYMQSIQSLEMYTKNISHGITPEDFAGGSNLYVYNLTPDLNFSGNISQVFEQCNLRLDLKFKSALTESINVVIYTIYDSSLEIDSEYRITQW